MRGRLWGVSIDDALLGETASMVEMGCELSIVARELCVATTVVIMGASLSGAFGTKSGIGLMGVS